MSEEDKINHLMSIANDLLLVRKKLIKMLAKAYVSSSDHDRAETRSILTVMQRMIALMGIVANQATPTYPELSKGPL